MNLPILMTSEEMLVVDYLLSVLIGLDHIFLGANKRGDVVTITFRSSTCHLSDRGSSPRLGSIPAERRQWETTSPFEAS